MKIHHNVSPQQISWVKSNKEAFDASGTTIENVYYPETIEELTELVGSFYRKKNPFTLIGYSSNTLFMPSFVETDLICTKKLDRFSETEFHIECECGVNVSKLAKDMVHKGYKGFEGLTDLPGTLAAAVYGNCGCRGCSVNELVSSVDLLKPDSKVESLTTENLKLQYRSSSLKRNEMKGVITKIRLNKIVGNADELLQIAEKNHLYRKKMQPSAANNLGTTFNGGSEPTIKGRLLRRIERIIGIITRTNDSRITYPKMLKLIGKGKFAPYVYYWNRYMFLDASSHLLFPEYIDFVKSLYKDARLEIEIKK